MEAILDVVLPVFAIILCGYLAARFKVLGDDSSEALNRFVFYVAMPVLLFRSMAVVELDRIFHWSFLGAYMGGQLVVFGITLVLSRTLFKNRLGAAAVAGMAGIFGNTGYMGIPLSITAFGDAAALPAILATVVNAAIVVGVIAALVEVDLSPNIGIKGVLRDVAGALLRNPMLVAPVLGILWAATGVALPKSVDTFATILGAAAGPCALFALGLFLAGQDSRGGKAETSFLVVVKLVVHPLATWLLARMLMPDEPFMVALVVLMAALPAGANVFVMAQRYGVFVARASSATLITTLLSVASLSVLLPLLKASFTP